MYFLMACRDEPPRSFNSLIALLTISDVGGCVGLLAVLPFFAATFFVDAAFGEVAWVAAAVSLTSDIIFD